MNSMSNFKPANMGCSFHAAINNGYTFILIHPTKPYTREKTTPLWHHRRLTNQNLKQPITMATGMWLLGRRCDKNGGQGFPLLQLEHLGN